MADLPDRPTHAVELQSLNGLSFALTFEAAIIADYDARTAVERELALRIASLLCGYAAPP